MSSIPASGIHERPLSNLISPQQVTYTCSMKSHSMQALKLSFLLILSFSLTLGISAQDAPHVPGQLLIKPATGQAIETILSTPIQV
jgi:hypothetical protein